MHLKRLGLGIFTTAMIGTIAACGDDTARAATLVAPNAPSLAKGSSNGGGNPHVTNTAVRITMSPATMQLAVGASGWTHVTLYDKAGNALPDNDGSLVWYGCTPADPALQNCMGYVSIAPVYPNLRDAYITAVGAGTFTLWADDGAGHRATTTLTVQ
jgi:hypothetical protein